MTMHHNLARAFAEKNALKIISGLNNFNLNHVTSVVKAAEAGGATFVDIAAEPTLVKTIRNLKKMVQT